MVGHMEWDEDAHCHQSKLPLWNEGKQEFGEVFSNTQQRVVEFWLKFEKKKKGLIVTGVKGLKLVQEETMQM